MSADTVDDPMPVVPPIAELLKDSPFKDSQLEEPQVPDDIADPRAEPENGQRQADHESGRPAGDASDVPAIEQWTPASYTRYDDGQVETKVFAEPTFKRTDDGWERLSGRLTQTEGARLRADDALFPVDFASSGSRLLGLSFPAGRVEMSLDDAQLTRPAVTTRNGVTTLLYEGVYPDVDLRYEVQGAAVKEAFIIKTPQAQRAFSFDLKDPNGLLGEAVEDGNGGYRFVDEVAEDTTVALSPPVAWERGSAPPKDSGSVVTAHQTVAETDKGFRVDVRLDDDWAESRSFPVVLDPTITYTYGAGTLVSGYAPGSATACSGSPCPLVSNADGSTFVGPGDDSDVAYFQMDLSNIPSDTDIASAEFTLGYWYSPNLETELRSVNSALPTSPTGADVLAAQEPEVIAWSEITGSGSLTSRADLTDLVLYWIENGLADNAGLSLQSIPNFYSTGFPSLALTDGPDCPLYYGRGYCYYDPTLTINSVGDPLPPPLPVEQTWGCNCRWFHGPDAVNYEGDPVSTASGHMMEHFVDLTTTAPGMPIAFSRTYNGQDTTNSTMGVGWTHEYNSSVTVQATTGDVVFKDPTGGRMVFRAQPGGTYLGDPGVTGTLTKLSNGTWRLRSTTGEVLTFNSAGRETSDKDAAGYGVTLAYAGGRLSTLTDAAGNVTTITYGTTGPASGKVVKAQSDDGRAVSYGYTSVAGASRLTTSTDAVGKVTTYTYNTTTGRLTGIKDPLNQVSAQNVFDPTTGRITQQTDGVGNTLSFAWVPTTTQGAPAGTGTNTTTDENGDVVSVDTYYGHVLTAHADGEGNTTRYYYDAALNTVAVTNPRGNVTRMTYDSRGNMLTKTTPDALVESWAYDANDNPTGHTAPGGAVTTYTHDAGNRPLTVTDPTGGLTQYTYSAQGFLTSEVSPAGRTTTYTYDVDGNVLSRTSPGGNKTTYTYDAAGNMLTETDPRGNVTGAAPSAFTTTYTHDTAGRVLTSTNPVGTVTTHTYDANGRTATTKLRDVNGNTVQDTAHTYDANGRLLTTMDFTQATVTNTYDIRGRLASSTDADAGKTTYVYDKADRVISKTTPRGNTAGSNPLSFTWYYSYDANGNQVATTDRDGRVTRTEYDALDRPSAQISPLGHRTTTSYVFDNGGTTTTVTDPLGHQSTARYNSLGHLAWQKRPGEGSTSFGYDADGLKISATSPSGASVTRWTYDADGNVKTVVDPLGTPTGATASQHTITSTYDRAGNQTAVTDQLGKTTTWTYNAANQPLTKTNPRGQTINYAYDLVGRLTSVTAPADTTGQSAVTSYDYDNYGNVVHKIDPRGNTTYLSYNAKRQVTSTTDPLGRTKGYHYDPEGNLEAIFNARSRVSGANPDDHYVYLVHDQRGLLLGTVTPQAESTSYYSYDDDGNLAQTSDDVMGLSNLTYDANGRLTQLDQPSGDFDYTYDAAGHVATRDYQYGSQLTYRYNADGLADQITENDGVNAPSVIGFAYNAAQALTAITYPASTGMTETRAYDAAGRVASIETKKASATTPVSRYDYTRDAHGNPTMIKRTRGTTVYNEALTYNPQDALRSYCPGATTCTNATNRVNHVYDKNGNLTTENRLGTVPSPGLITNTYDTANQLTTRATTTGATTTTATQTYDADGNLTTGGRTWNMLNQLTASNTTGTAKTDYTYDAFNNRRTAATATATGAKTQRVLWDINNPMPMPALVSEPDNSTTTQVYAPDGSLIASRRLYKAYTADYYAHDDRGSVTDAFKPNGTPTWANSYDPWGETLTHTKVSTDAIENYFGYMGSYLEPATGDLSLRARDYNPNVGRFNSTDPIAGALTDPYMSPYAYAGNRPTVFMDPTGLCWSPSCIASNVGEAIGNAVDPYVTAVIDTPLVAVVGFGGGAIGMFDGNPQLNAAFANMGGSPSGFYFTATNMAFGIDGSETAAQAGGALSILIPIGGAFSAAAKLAKFCKRILGVSDDVVPAAGALSSAANSGSSIAGDLAAAERHLASIPDALEYGPNKAMLDGIRSANNAGRPLNAAERTFLDHELLEAQLVRGGLSQEAAHAEVLKVYPPGSNYSPEVIKEFSDHFSDAYFQYWGITR